MLVPWLPLTIKHSRRMTSIAERVMSNNTRNTITLPLPPCFGQQFGCYTSLWDLVRACCLQTHSSGRKGKFSLCGLSHRPPQDGDRASIEARLRTRQTHQFTQVSNGHLGCSRGKYRCGCNSLFLPHSLVLVLDVINVTSHSDLVQSWVCLTTGFRWKASLNVPSHAER